MPLPANHTALLWLPEAATPVRDTLSDLATLADSLTGAEERAVWLPAARRTLAYRIAPRTVAAGVQLVEALRLVRVGGRASVPHWGRGRVLSAYTIGNNTIVSSLPHGLLAGAMAALYRPDDVEARLVEVQSVASTTTLTLTTTIPSGWAGTVWLAPVRHGRLGEPRWTPRGDMLRAQVEFTEYPPPPTPAASWVTFETDSIPAW